MPAPGAGSRVVDKPGGRKVTVVGDARSQGSAWWLEGDDLVLSLGSPEGVDLMIECLDGVRPDATRNPVRASLVAAEAGFTPVGLAFLDRAALPPCRHRRSPWASTGSSGSNSAGASRARP